jgi:hypothetical protein
MSKQPIKRNRPKHYRNAKTFNGLYLWQIAKQLGMTLGAIERRVKLYGTPYWTYNPKKKNLHAATHPPERHGMSRTPEYKIYSAMVTRCENPHHKQFKDYGGRGISVCDRWRQSFVAFIHDVGRRPKRKNMTLDRIDNNGNYEPGNVEWRTRQENQRNTRANRNITWNGKTQCISAWAADLGVTTTTLIHRIDDSHAPLSIALTRKSMHGKPLLKK